MRINNLKKIVFLLALLLNILPSIKNGGLNIESTSVIEAQNSGSELVVEVCGWYEYGEARLDQNTCMITQKRYSYSGPTCHGDPKYISATKEIVTVDEACMDAKGGGTTDTGTTDTGITYPGTGGIGSTTKTDPCSGSVNGVKLSDPLVDMKIQGTARGINGGLFGLTRYYSDGRPKLHGGVDFAAPIGTPVYATEDGVITRTVTEQPNKNYGKYPDNYSGDRNDGGNRIYLNGDSGPWWYMHLQAGNPVATNPRTGELFKTGDYVFQGEIIGYVGITGNSSPSAPHLHLQLDGTNPSDPIPHIYSKFNPNGTVSNPCK